jgi:hypothetical protein
MSIARGKPVVMYGQNIKPHDGFSFDGLNYVKHWDAYKDYMFYPYDIEGRNDPEMVMEELEYASKNEASDWKAKFIGDPLDPDKLMNALEGVLQDARS